MNKSIEEKRDALADKYVSLSGPAITRFMMSWDFKNGFDSGLTIGLEQAKVLVERLEILIAEGYANQIDKKALKEFKERSE